LNLGVMYASGQGMPRDYVEAHKWFNLAASNLPDSQAEFREVAVNDRDLAARKMTPAQVAEAQKLARAWHPN
jgi:TPR repeat protein